MELSQIDKNMAIQTVTEKDGMVFYNPDNAPFRIYGVTRYGERYYRLPAEVAETVSPGVAALCRNTAGGRIRFITDSRRIAIIAKRDRVEFSDHMTYITKAGYDLYADDDYYGSFRPAPNPTADSFEASVSIEGDRTDRVITINMPLYGPVRELLIGLEADATLMPAPDYKLECPVVYYGSSITQGGCASRPGMSYQAIISRRLGVNHVNLGFSGNARGEDAIADYIAGLEMSAFVYDYDHNAPNPTHLELTHAPMFDKIRAAHPDIPIIMVSRPRNRRNLDRERRLEIIKATYDRAVAAGDENVYLVNGGEFFGEVGNDGTVDGCHPTDLGFWCMANGIAPVLEAALKKCGKI